MILIADSGSTKTDWVLKSKQKKEYFKTNGLNPFHSSENEIKEILKSLKIDFKKVKQIYFYGAGCANKEINKKIKNPLKEVFINSKIRIGSDMEAAAISLFGDEAGIAAILGTGSNTCFYNGKEIEYKIPALGYILGDEASGTNLGKKLLISILNKELNKEIIELFNKEFRFSKDDILQKIYKEDFPNRFMAGFTHFIRKNTDNKQIYSLVKEDFNLFFERTILKYREINNYKTSFTGSVAYHFKDILTETAKEKNVKIDKILKSPLEGLCDYHSVS